jgi:RND family efflux transporter MFP subunit
MSFTKPQWLTPLLLILVAAALAAVMVITRPEAAKVEAVQRTLLVDVAKVVQQDLQIPIHAQGTVTPHRETDIVAEVAGRVIEVSPSFYVGGYVTKGELLLRIDAIEHESRLNQAQANLASAESMLAQEQGRSEVAKQEYERFPRKHSSDTARDLYLRKPQLKQAQAQLLSAQADLRKAQHDLDRTVIRAPYDSIIKAKQSELGLYLSPGTPVASLFAVDFAEVRLAIPQSRLPYLELPELGTQRGQQMASVDLYTNVADELQHWNASLHRTEGVYDERSRVLYAVARVDDPYRLDNQANDRAAVEAGEPAPLPLRMGTFVAAVIKGRVIENLVLLPRSVLRAGNHVWVVDQDNTLRNRKVSTLRTQGKEVYVNGGLQDGDLVCLTALGEVVAGSPVKITSTIATDQLFAPNDSLPLIVEEGVSQQQANLPKADATKPLSAKSITAGSAL